MMPRPLHPEKTLSKPAAQQDMSNAPEISVLGPYPLTTEVLQRLLDALPEGVALVNKAGTVLLTNECWQQDHESRATQPGDSFQGVGQDELTGAVNRRRFYEQAERALQHADNEMTAFSLVYLDLDNFKAVNDQHGHAVGDAVLAHVSARLQSLLREGDVLARFGGDEFVLLLAQVSAMHRHSVLERLRALLRHPYGVEGHVLRVQVSLGGASYPEDGATIDALLRYADKQMYTHKARAE